MGAAAKRCHAPSPLADTLRDALLSWYDRAARDLPWRRTRDPYAVWVSEVMLQQTRVETAIPYYERFLGRFPTTGDLAAAAEDEVLALWSGLGYYRRARLLHAGAREVVERYGGRVPAEAEARRSLPGVGRYTAGAIGSIAFDREEAVVDGNVGRVLARLHCIETPLGRAVTDRALWAMAAELVRGPRPGDLNQALMELGATVCTPASPRCGSCPVAPRCGALASGRVGELPVPKAVKAPRDVELVAVVATTARPPRVWLERGEGSLFGGLWGVPMGEGADRQAARALLRRRGIAARLPEGPDRSLVHVLTHRRLRVRIFRATAARGRSAAGLRRVAPEQLGALGVSRLTRRILEAW